MIKKKITPMGNREYQLPEIFDIGRCTLEFL